MPLDPDIADLLARRRDEPDLFDGDVDAARARFAADLRTTARSAPEQPAPDVVPDRPVPVRWHRAADAGAVVVFLHGGGWVLGGGDAYDPLAARLAADTGACVAAVDYRLAPEHPFPTPLEDAIAATRRIVAKAGDRPWALVGDSAGANLAAGVALALRDEGVRRPAATLLLYPATDFEGRYPSVAQNAEGYWLTAAGVTACSRLYLAGHDPRGDARLSPLRAASLAGLGPTIVATAGYDPLRDAGTAFVDALAAAGTPSLRREHPTLVHGFAGFTAAAPAADAAVGALHGELAGMLAADSADPW